jgi:hypothetical protein
VTHAGGFVIFFFLQIPPKCEFNFGVVAAYERGDF